ncbi:hypothetical protein [Polyangium spumosum]|uniref:Uncharacterized protein n=1 Tax=Polyangium spumosum TaxID=889282 RepID=A0A6N7Q2C6_9BACT|nr:hypothetical protein [Polyangium spumosum]MRG96765.1 hypothetical protein [Polyangium spumosum]
MPVTRRKALVAGLSLFSVGVIGYVTYTVAKFPPDTTPEGAYMRVAANLAKGDARTCFHYLEDSAQHAAYSIRDYRKKASERISQAYPEPERTRLLDAYRAHATAEDGADVWVDLATKRGFVTRLRKDLSGLAKVEIVGERATVETARGTRYGFRRRENGMWGLTLFTADLVAESERAARDWDIVERAAKDYERGR